MTTCRWQTNTDGWIWCNSTKIRTSGPVTADVCAGCALRDHEPVPGAVRSSRKPLYVRAVPTPAARPDCVELGRPLRDDEIRRHGLDPAACRSCGGKIRQCGLHEICTTGTPKPGIAFCGSCSDYISGKSREYPEVTTRHMLYHIWPKRMARPLLRLNVHQLRTRLDLFNGRRVIAVATGPETDTLDAVRAEFGVDASRCEFIELPNDRSLREVVSFRRLWELVRTTDPTHATFYAHAKGIGRPWNRGTTVHEWTKLLYQVCLDRWPSVAASLRRHAVVGALKKLGHGFQGSRSNWHFTGTFFWARNAEVFSRRWDIIDPQWWGSESWIGLHFHQDEAGALLYTAPIAGLDMYHLGFVQTVIKPMLEHWKSLQEEHENHHLLPVRRGG